MKLQSILELHWRIITLLSFFVWIFSLNKMRSFMLARLVSLLESGLGETKDRSRVFVHVHGEGPGWRGAALRGTEQIGKQDAISGFWCV